jgi:hypothetical protein
MSNGTIWTRREALGSGIAAAMALAGRCRYGSGADDAGDLDLVVRETAGLRRFSYPVHTVLPGVALAGSFRLLKDGREVPAQFRRVVGDDGRAGIALDFTSSLGPLESERYRVEARPAAEPAMEPKRGMEVDETGGSFRVRNGKALAYVIASHLPGFLESVVNSGREYLEVGSGGLFLTYRKSDGDHAVRLGGEGGRGISGTVTRQGLFAVGLRYEGSTAVPGGAPVAAKVDLTFPSSKSWVEATWRVDDPQGVVAGLSVEIRLKLEGGPALVDVGTAATIYGVLRGRERMTLTAGSGPGLPPLDRPWVVEKGPPDTMTVFAEAPALDSPPAEGWAHVMDASRCTALALADFGRGTRDSITIDSTGRFQINRDFTGRLSPVLRGPKALRFWFHFVPMPVQVGAATSPQAMLAPLAFTWVNARR